MRPKIIFNNDELTIVLKFKHVKDYVDYKDFIIRQVE